MGFSGVVVSSEILVIGGLLQMSLKPGLVVFSGCMFCGKTSRLMLELERATYAGYSYQAFKPVVDNRYSGTGVIENHNGQTIDCVAVSHSALILRDAKLSVPVIGIDEAQFFNDGVLVDVVLELVEELGKLVFVAGLNLDFRGEPFGEMPELMNRADRVVSLTAICMHSDCDQEAVFTQRVVNGEPADYRSPTILVGGREAYEARCREHHVVRNKPARRIVIPDNVATQAILDGFGTV